MGSAKAKRMERLVYVLEHASTWIPASTLAKTVGTTERSIRNYVAEINEAGGDSHRIAPSRLSGFPNTHCEKQAGAQHERGWMSDIFPHARLF